ncbi:transcription factor HES-4-like [Orbicella faveolata]|uniref:transcription factor HES-4-like n=1 Tax=Orbicella faveolata TaxID=48498 RepID=UPI0009E241BE|nr:transcription factor HES-4-like [Orbicella faveolata]XP_020606360.1 transcription factor HES-4-like [Orbicella faveolata]
MPRHSNGKRQSPRKPEMERIRRQRINKCLSQIKLLIPEAKELEIKKGCRLEKAEILEIAVQFIQRVQNKTNTRKQEETSVGLEECSAFFNSSTASTRPIFQGHFDLPQNHNPSSPFFSAPACCLQPCECCDSVKQISQNRLYRSLFPPAYPRIFKPRCVSSNMAYVPVTSGLETFAIPPQEPADLSVSVKAETD